MPLATHNILYTCVVVLLITIVENGYNLYNTDRNRNTDLYYDCLRYTTDGERFHELYSDKFIPSTQVMFYCIRPFNNEIENNESTHGNFSLFQFDELTKMNVTVRDLLKWSIPFDVIEDYQEYLHTLVPILAKKVLKNCSYDSFGSYCQYSINDETKDFRRYVSFTFFSKDERSSNELFPLKSTYFTCYIHLNCGRCLDWREICDGKIDCLIDGTDEQNCFDLEKNECTDNEYRCHNGLCIPEIFVNDHLYNPDCLDSSDEFGTIDSSLRVTGFQRCHRDPSFRCEESHHPLRLRDFPCGDGHTSYTFQSCQNGRHLIHFEWHFLYEQNTDLSFDCWLVLSCATRLTDRTQEPCRKFCKGILCVYNVQDTCNFTMIFFPQQLILHDHIRFAYLTNKTIHRRTLEQPKIPDYVCYDARRCPFLTPTLYFNGSACKLTIELNFTRIHELDWFFRTCPIDYGKNNFVDINEKHIFQCPGTKKFISKHRLHDGIFDCYDGSDEKNVDTCSLNDKYRFKCHSEQKCISYITLYDHVGDCLTKEDEENNKGKDEVIFQNFCNGFPDELIRNSDRRNKTDQPDCTEWPCNNMYTRCDGAWSCLNGADESNCPYTLCSTHLNTVPCISPYNFSQICLPISRANDNITDCLGSTDERSYCRSLHHPLKPYKCWNESKCVYADEVCAEKVCSFDDIQNQCENNELVRAILYRTKQDYEFLNSNPIRYFTLGNVETFPYVRDVSKSSSTIKPLVRTKRILKKTLTTIADSSITSDKWKCNRGIVIGMIAENKYRCFCPPSYYGDHCQYQSQRVSLTLQMRKICAPICQSVFGILITLLDHQHIIHSQEQLTYISTRDCNTKFNVYLLYNKRSKDLNKNYTIRVDVYNRINISFHASWIFPIEFAFLPVNRLSIFLIIPATPITSTCSKFCRYGRCLSYVNIAKQYCLCESGWSGEQCTIPLHCSCSSDSLCLGVINNRSTCMCPLDKFGPRCLLPSVCRSNPCTHKEQICIPIDNDDDKSLFHCLCWPKFVEHKCEHTLQLKISFSKLIIPQVLLTHLITVYWEEEPTRITTPSRIRQDQDEAVIYLPTHIFHLAFIQIEHEFYLIMLTTESKSLSPVTKLKVDPSRRCPHIQELFGKQILSYPLSRRIKYYHMACRQQLNIPCFHDQDEFMCLCTTERYGNCFNFDFNITYDCNGLGDCKNDGKCFQDEISCPTWMQCICPDCFYGSKCQFSTKSFDISLDIILGYAIRPNLSFNHQPSLVKISTILTLLMFLIGILNGILSTMTFQAKELRQIGCGNYLLATSIISIPTIIIFTFKFICFLLFQMSIINNEIFLNINCISLDFILRSLLAISGWFSASISIERMLTVIKGVNFNKKKSCQIALVVICLIIIITFSSIVHDPIYRRLVTDETEQRIWCIIQYDSFYLDLFNSIVNIFHFIIPFSINIISAIAIIINAARQRAVVQKQISYRQHLREQWSQHSHLIITSIILVLLAVPRLIISFLSGCMKSPRYPGIYLAGYFISYLPPFLTFLTYILPSKTYKKHFYKLIKHYRIAIQRVLNIH